MNSIDFVLVWDSSIESSKSKSAIIKRQNFESNLAKEGLILKEESNLSLCPHLHFITISTPKDVCRTYSEILKLRLPMKKFETLTGQEHELLLFNDASSSSSCSSSIDSPQKNSSSSQLSCLQKFERSYLKLNPNLIPSSYSNQNYDDMHESKSRLSAVFSRDREYLFAINELDEASFFTPAIRSRIVDFILKRTYFSSAEAEDAAAANANISSQLDFGLETLLKNSIYSAAYPLHDGHLNSPASIRHLLFHEWTSLKKCYKYQPLDIIKDYFGVKIGLYFAWLGFYTTMLIPISVLGLACFIFGLATLNSNQHVLDVCSSVIAEPMCPLCNKYCNYWNISSTCFYAKLTHLFDNESTVLFSIIISLWTVIFLECWKRYSASICYHWDLSQNNNGTEANSSNEQHPRSEYLTRLQNVKKTKLNSITNKSEPFVSFWTRKLPNLLFSASISWLLISLAIVAILGVIMYRLSLKVLVLSEWSQHSSSSYGLLIVNISAVTINLIFILIFNHFYTHLANYLTEIELHRTQEEFDDSLTLKIYLLQFVNFYSSIFYIAFFKGKFSGSPHHYNTIFGYRNEECSPGGCMSEMCIQLAIIMIGKQLLNAGIENTLPILKKWSQKLCRRCRMKSSESKHNNYESSSRSSSPIPLPSSFSNSNTKSLGKAEQWIQDYELLEWNSRSLFPEYLEMILQFGFITIFVASFPLGPLFALLNNVFEMRLDAKKMLKYYRRPVSQRIGGDIGIWTNILNIISRLGVISNAFIIAFTSDFIPKLIYRLEYGSLDGYLEYSLASFNTSGFDVNVKPIILRNNNMNVSICRYESFGKSFPNQALELDKHDLYWKVWLARFIFVVVFQNFIFSLLVILEWIIPDIPKSLSDKMRQEEYTINELIIQQQMKTRTKKKNKLNLSKSKSLSSSLKYNLNESMINLVDSTSNQSVMNEMKEIKVENEFKQSSTNNSSNFIITTNVGSIQSSTTTDDDELNTKL